MLATIVICYCYIYARIDMQNAAIVLLYFYYLTVLILIKMMDEILKVNHRSYVKPSIPLLKYIFGIQLNDYCLGTIQGDIFMVSIDGHHQILSSINILVCKRNLYSTVRVV